MFAKDKGYVLIGLIALYVAVRRNCAVFIPIKKFVRYSKVFIAIIAQFFLRYSLFVALLYIMVCRLEGIRPCNVGKLCDRML